MILIDYSDNLSGKIDLKRTDQYVALSNLRIYYTSKNQKKLKYVGQQGRKILYLNPKILYLKTFNSEF